MAIISQETWDNMPKEEKEKIIEYYKSMSCGELQQHAMEILYGKENLQPKPKVPKTWEDVKEAYPKTYGNENIELFPYNEFAWDVKLIRKNIATLKISKLIELGYGGMVTEEEWKDDTICKECVVPYDTKEGFKIITRFFHSDKNLIAFHTQQQAEEFMSYPENRKLVEQYYMF